MKKTKVWFFILLAYSALFFAIGCKKTEEPVSKPAPAVEQKAPGLPVTAPMPGQQPVDKALPEPANKPDEKTAAAPKQQKPEGIAYAPKQKPSQPSDGAETKEVETRAVIETKFGNVELRLFPDSAPNHVKNFVELAKKGFYDGTIFHRVIPGFMIQGGDPNSKDPDRSRHGAGGPGYTVKAEFNDRPHKRGTLSMARAKDPDSAGSQFFICVKDTPFLDKQYTVFGEVVSGMDAVDKIVMQPRDGRDDPNERIEMKVRVTSVAPVKEQRAEKAPSPAKVLHAAPLFSLPDKDNNMVSLRNYRGKVVLMVYTATWSPHYRKAAPEFKAMYEKYKDKGFIILSLFADDASKVEAFTKSTGLAYPALIDDGTVQKNYGIKAIPYFIILDRQGRIVKKAHYGLTLDIEKDLAREIEALL